jgi:hypothetical protein
MTAPSHAATRVFHPPGTPAGRGSSGTCEAFYSSANLLRPYTTRSRRSSDRRTAWL